MTQRIVTPERPLVVPPLLAAEIGLAEAIILQQINYWLRKSKHIIDGVKWIWQTFNQWQEQFPFLSMRQIRQGINKLKALGLIRVERKSAKTWYQANWYSICYDNLKALWHRICPPRANASDRSDQIHLHEAIASDQETSSSKEFSSNTPPNPPQECDADIRPKAALVVNEGIQKCAEILGKLSIKVEEPQKRRRQKAEIDSLDKFSAAAPPREKLPSIPLEDELKYQGVDTSNRWLLEAVTQSPDPYLAIKAWLAWARETTVEAPTQSLLKAIRDGWRPRDQVESGNVGAAVPLNNSQLKSLLESIPPCPEGLGEWAKYHKLSHRVRAIAYSNFLKCWCVYYNDTTCLPWIDAVNQGDPIFKVARNDSGFYVEVQF